MNKKEGSTDGSKPRDEASIRLAVFEWIEGEKKHLSILALKKGEDEKWTLNIEGPDIERMKPYIERFRDERRKLAENGSPVDRALLSKALTDLLTSERFIVEELPEGDHLIDFQFDQQTGRILGMHTPLHPLAAANADAARKTFQAIARSLGDFANQSADEIETLLANGDIDGAASTVKRDAERGLLGLPTNDRLLSALMQIDVAKLSHEQRFAVREVRYLTACRLGNFAVAGHEADYMLGEDTGLLDAGYVANLKMASGLGARERGQVETALEIWRDILRDPSDLDIEGRAWALRNISNTLSLDDPEALDTARRSSDAFLASGNKPEASKSLFRVATILMRKAPSEALVALDEMIAVLDKEGLNDRHIRAAALFAGAIRLAALGRHKEALRDAVEAVDLQRGLLGAESQLISALHLVSMEARSIGDTENADAFAAEATKLSDEFKIPHFELSKRLEALAKHFDARAAETLVRDAEKVNKWEVTAMVRVIQATLDPALTPLRKLQILEEVHSSISTRQDRGGMRRAVATAIAAQLSSMGRTRRALDWYRKLHSDDPNDAEVAVDLVNILGRQKEWGEAAIILKKQLDLLGERPGILFAYGRALFEAADFNGAIDALTRSLKLGGGNETMMTQAREIRDRAFDLCGKAILPVPAKLATGPVSRKEFEAELKEFGSAVSKIRRMAFWRHKDGKRAWVERPERLAQHFLHIFLQAKFVERTEIEGEVVAGAGRIDLFVKLIGNMSIVVELKMCGLGYSSRYAAAGEQQITHYMTNRATQLGYLLVFDGRAKSNGKRVLPRRSGPQTIVEYSVDVRPEVKQPPKRGKQKRRAVKRRPEADKSSKGSRGRSARSL